MPRPLPSRSPVLGALASAAASLLLAAPAAAAPLPRLVVHRAPAAADCPDAPALAAAVERQMQRPALDPASADRFAPLFEVQILHSDEGYTAILQAGGRARQIADPGPTCAGLAEALAITLAILLDSELPANRAPPPPEPPPQPPPRPPPQPPPPLPPEPPRKRWDVSIDAGAALTTGLLTPLSGALVADVSLRLRGGSFGAGVLWLPVRTFDFPPGTVDMWLAVATLRGCAAVLGAALEGARLSLCGQPMLGAIHGEGHGYTPDREGTVPWFALAATALGEGPIAGPLGWSARAMLVVPITQESFTVDRRQGDQVQPAVAFDPSPVGLLVGIGARLTIP